ncbi:MAG: hypothetical protein ACOX52_16645 [Verrucomicrobiota bacterium]
MPSVASTATVPGFSCPNPITRPFDTETDSDPDPDLASSSTPSDGLLRGKGPDARNPFFQPQVHADIYLF